jgi:hypothetical protein
MSKRGGSYLQLHLNGLDVNPELECVCITYNRPNTYASNGLVTKDKAG